MKVDSNRAHPPVTAQSHHNMSKKIQQSEPQGPNKQVEKSASDAESASKQNRAQGAIRLLQEGHFKGVAALRLRINFFDQLSGLEQENIQATARESIDELSLAIQDQVDGLANNGLTEEQTLPQLTEITDTFVSDLQDSITGEELNPQQLISTLQQNYDNFRTSLQNLLLPPETPPSQEAEAPQVDPNEEISTSAAQVNDDHSDSMGTRETEQPPEQIMASPVNSVEESTEQAQHFASLEALDSTFNSQLSELEDRLQESTLLSVPEQQDNEGAAFQKFLSIYQDMQNSAETGNEPDDTQGS